MCKSFVENKIGLNRKIYNLGFNNIPACGTNEEVLSHHKLDTKSIYDKNKKKLK